MNDVEEKVAGIIREIIDIEDISLDANLLGDLGFDSLDKVDLQCELEKRFGINIPDEEMAMLYPFTIPNSKPDETKYASVKDIVEYVKRRTGEKEEVVV